MAGMADVFLVLLLFSAAFAAISLRLFRSAWHARGAEGWLGLAFLCVAISMPLRWLIQRSDLVAPDEAPAFLLGGHALMALGLSAFTLFVDRVFRPDSGWALGVTGALIALQIVSLPALVLFGGHRDEQHLSVAVVGLCRALPFAWGFVESRRYHALMKRRQTLGLADAVVTNRFALFAIWSGSLVGLPAVLFVVRLWVRASSETGRLVAQDGSLTAPAWVLAAALVGFGSAAAVTLWLSFFPPKAWLARVEARVAAAD
ncbi:MAG: hypothetical protein AAGC67_19170 [Myxococcota bacterium]